MSHRVTLIPTAVLISVAFAAPAADGIADQRNPRIVGELLLGSSGPELGVAGEWWTGPQDMMVRPELLLFDLGIGVSVQWPVGSRTIADPSYFTCGPRLAFHSSDNDGWEVGGMGIWHMDLSETVHSRHYLEIIGALGLLEHKHHDDHTLEIGATIGVGYGYQF